MDERNAQRLQAAIPKLAGLVIEVQEFSQIACIKYTKRFHVASAPLLFELRCGDERCTHGGYDITHRVVHALRAHETRSRGDCQCDGTTGTANCGRHIHFELFAEYRA
ncbi:MAG TPA: hypothetical protein VI299_15885 [Polyangiales bacterium]